MFSFTTKTRIILTTLLAIALFSIAAPVFAAFESDFNTDRLSWAEIRAERAQERAEKVARAEAGSRADQLSIYDRFCDRFSYAHSDPYDPPAPELIDVAIEWYIQLPIEALCVFSD